MPTAKTVDPIWETRDGETVRIFHGDVFDVLNRLPRESVHMVVTSPPYWGLRDYGTGSWEGGDPSCDHEAPPTGGRVKGAGLTGPGNRDGYSADGQYKTCCRNCGARRTDNQIGSEDRPDCGIAGSNHCGECFVCHMVEVFRGVRRVLRDDGTLWLNLGDTWSAPGMNGVACVPWRVALALQGDVWYLHSYPPWVKRSAMPESVANRPAKALEFVFMFTKGKGHYFDMEAVKPKTKSELNPVTWEERKAAGATGGCMKRGSNQQQGKGVSHDLGGHDGTRRFLDADLWFQSVDSPHGLCGIEDELVGLDVTTKGKEGVHFATYPPKLIEPLILASTSIKVCAGCGKPYVRVTEKTKLKRERPNEYVKRKPSDSSSKLSELDRGYDGHRTRVGLSALRDAQRKANSEGSVNTCGNSVAGVSNRTLRWDQDCKCRGEDTTEATVLDPFIGSGTTAEVCLRHGRKCWGIDLNEGYLRATCVGLVEGVLRRIGRTDLIPRD